MLINFPAPKNVTFKALLRIVGKHRAVLNPDDFKLDGIISKSNVPFKIKYSLTQMANIVNTTRQRDIYFERKVKEVVRLSFLINGIAA